MASVAIPNAVINVKYTVNKRENNMKNVGLEELTARLMELGKTQSDIIDIVLGVAKTDKTEKLEDKIKVWLLHLNQKHSLSIEETTESSDFRNRFFDKFYDAKTPAARVVHLIESAVYAHKLKIQQNADNIIRSALSKTLAEPSPPPELGVFITKEKIEAYMNSRR